MLHVSTPLLIAHADPSCEAIPQLVPASVGSVPGATRPVAAAGPVFPTLIVKPIAVPASTCGASAVLTTVTCALACVTTTFSSVAALQPFRVASLFTSPE